MHEISAGWRDALGGSESERESERGGKEKGRERGRERDVETRVRTRVGEGGGGFVCPGGG